MVASEGGNGLSGDQSVSGTSGVQNWAQSDALLVARVGSVVGLQVARYGVAGISGNQK